MRVRGGVRPSMLLFILVAQISLSGDVLAWNFDEHQSFGDLGFVRACEKAVSAKNKTMTALLQDGATCQTVMLAGRRSYGELTALAGDIIDSPYVFTDRPAELEELSNSSMNYLRLAHYNKDHFQQRSLYTYQFYHRAALLEALSAVSSHREDDSSTTGSHGEAQPLDPLRRALAINAFADHFLADSFAAGHIRPNRDSLPDRLSKRLHDKDNKENVGPDCWKVHKKSKSAVF